MHRPLHLPGTVTPHPPWRRGLFIGCAVLLEVGAIYVVASGLTTHVLNQLPQTLKVDIFKPPPPKQAPPPLPQVTLVKPSLPTVPPPEIVIQQPPQQQNPMRVIESAHPVQQPPTPVTAAPAPPAAAPAPPKPVAPAPTPVEAIASTHTQPPYPMTARRIGEQGTVVLSITISTDGSVQNVSVAQSSGNADLDQAAVEWVKDHWRYKPATRDGQPVVSQSEAKVVFNLQNAEQAG